MNKRNFLKTTFLLGAGAIAAPSLLASDGKRKKAAKSSEGFVQPPLPYSYNALEPNIDALTMEIHYSKHHAAYTNNFNKAVKELGLEGKTLAEIMGKVSQYPASIRNNGGGFYNHNIFWESMSPKGGGVPKGKLADAINSSFGSFEKFKELFNAASMSVFGSGWAWLLRHEGKLVITTTANQDNHLMDVIAQKGTPVINLDVWEHAYYLKFQNRRADYIGSFWNVVDWSKAEERFGKK